MKMWMKVTVAAVALAVSGLAQAAITYNVNQSIGGGSVTGTLTTDGTLGALTLGNFTAWNLTLNGLNGATFHLDNTNSSTVDFGTNSNTTATASNIFYNYDGPAGLLGFQAPPIGGGSTYWCNASANGPCFQGASVVPGFFADPNAQFEARTGIQILASAAGAGGVPEPASWALMLGGFGLTGAALRRGNGRGRQRTVSVTYA
jgi:PEP-CTERM motif